MMLRFTEAGIEDFGDLKFLMNLTRLTEKIKNLENRMLQKPRILFATGSPMMEEKIKQQIHDFDFIDQSVMSVDVLANCVHFDQPFALIVSDVLRSKEEGMILQKELETLISQFPHMQVIAIGNDFNKQKWTESPFVHVFPHSFQTRDIEEYFDELAQKVGVSSH